MAEAGSDDSAGEVERRRPRRVYTAGDEPDARFTMANERTFLAWVRTALALMAAGVAIESLDASMPPAGHPLRVGLALLLLLAGVISSVTAFTRWVGTERALRTNSPLPAPRLAPLLAYGLALVGILAGVLLLLERI